jgi:hypothetical protein
MRKLYSEQAITLDVIDAIDNSFKANGFNVIDTKDQRTIWTGKIENYRRMGPNRGMFTGTNKIFLFLNTVFSDAIEKAWIDYGMLNTLRSLDKKPFSKQLGS